MVVGILEVNLISGKGLKRSDFFGKIDPYVKIQYKGQTRKSSVAKDGGRNPTWNDKMKLRAEFPGSGADYKLLIKVMDHDTFSSDDHIGEATVHVKELLEMGVEKGKAELKPTKYNVVDSDLTFVGELFIGVSYSLLQDRRTDAEEFGGWKHSQI
ncbi:16 kDa phloem protein 1 [Cardamine amara subsp. amara]|uniref:16 kDa phloem protein 1 n=1 Tax=Cardamine amara subsp. amara TaxID=228776 RepID=A0ABD1BN16_CARAN